MSDVAKIDSEKAKPLKCFPQCVCIHVGLLCMQQDTVHKLVDREKAAAARYTTMSRNLALVTSSSRRFSMIEFQWRQHMLQPMSRNRRSHIVSPNDSIISLATTHPHKVVMTITP
jgi:hypothetical protein